MAIKKDEEDKLQLEINQTNVELGSLKQSIEHLGESSSASLEQKQVSFADPKALQKDLELKDTQLETIRNKLESSKASLREKKQLVDELTMLLKISTSKHGQT